MGVPVISSCSLAKAIIEPAKEMPPTTIEKTDGNDSAGEGWVPRM